MPPSKTQILQETTSANHSNGVDSSSAHRWKYNPHLKVGLSLLLDGYLYACELGRDRWEFAVEIELLHSSGLNNNDVRWLIGKGYADHILEPTSKGKGHCSPSRSSRLVLPENACIVLTDAGVTFAQETLVLPEPCVPHNGQGASSDIPYWNAETHSLYWQGRLIKHFKHEAPYQEAILEAFEAAKWPQFIVVTLPKEDRVNPKERLRETIKNLNRSCGKRIRFTQEGNGGRVGWQAID